jgi:hypothetical protein
LAAVVAAGCAAGAAGFASAGFDSAGFAGAAGVGVVEHARLNTMSRLNDEMIALRIHIEAPLPGRVMPIADDGGARHNAGDAWHGVRSFVLHYSAVAAECNFHGLTAGKQSVKGRQSGPGQSGTEVPAHSRRRIRSGHFR